VSSSEIFTVALFVDLKWHAMSPADTLSELETSQKGLSNDEAIKRREMHGPNILTKAHRESSVALIGRQFANPLALVLMGSGVLAFLLGTITDGFVVLSVVVINAFIGAMQELRAAKAIAALDSLVPELATTFRDGDIVQVPAPELVPGDVVLVQSGSRVPADMRLIHANNAQSSEVALTGESQPVSKQTESVAKDTPLAERSCMLFAGTTLAQGTGTGAIVATGSETELGKISIMLQGATRPETPLVHNLKVFSKRLTKIICVAALGIVAIAYLRGFPPFEGMRAGVSFACASIPVALPATITISLAVAVRRMAAKNAIVRTLPSIEALGSTNIICSDKTGTLTVGEMSVRYLWSEGELFELTGVGYTPRGELRRKEHTVDPTENVMDMVKAAGALCNDAVVRKRSGQWSGVGSMTEIPLVVAAMKLGVKVEDLREKRKRIGEIPFDSKTRRMVTFDELPDGDQQISVKGAPEAVLEHCSGVDEKTVQEVVDLLAGEGMRVIAVGRKTPEDGQTELDDEDPQGAELIGLMGLQDPPRPEAIEAIAICHGAGVAIKMVTGDHPSTAHSIGVELGVVEHDNKTLTGADLEKLDDSELWQCAEEVNLFARVEPQHKLRLVEALQRRGHVVAMTGDGVNDAPALKQADVGIAMGLRGTAAARDAADVILVDDNFASIAAAVEEGRRCYENLMKLLSFLVPTAVGQGLIVLIGVLFFPIVQGVPQMPIYPLQILWVNFVTGVTLALPLAWEVADGDLMRRKPRVRDEPILGPHLRNRCVLVGILMAIGGIFVFSWQYDDVRPQMADIVFRRAQTMAVTTVVLFQVFYLLQCRSLHMSVFHGGALLTNPGVYFGQIATVLMQAVFVHSKTMNTLFHSAPLELDDWLVSTAVALLVLPFVSVHKMSALKKLRREKATWSG
jgi:magnesium-transporting ATPase (P-type)